MTEAAAEAPSSPVVSSSAEPAGDPPRRLATPLILFGVALGLRLIYLAQAAAADPLFGSVRLVSDSRFYDLYARAVAQGNLLPDAPFFLAPLYYYAMGAVYSLTGPAVFAIKIGQCCLGALSCVLLYAIGRRVFSEAVGVIAGACLCFYGLHIFYSGVILPTILVVFLNLLFLWLMVGARDDRVGLPRFLGAGLVLGLAAAAKPNAILLLPTTAAALVWLSGRAGLSKSALQSLALAVGTLAVIAPFTAHNYAVSGELVLLTTTGGRNLLKGNSEVANGTHVFLPADMPRTGLDHYLGAGVDAKIAVAEDRSMTARARAWALSNPGDAAALLTKKFALFFNAGELFIRDQFYFARRYSSLLSLPLLSFGFIAPLGLAGLALALRDRPRSVHLYGVLLAQAASYTLIFVLARYRLVAVCCLLLLGAQLAVSSAKRARLEGGRALVAPAVLCLIAALFVHLPFPEFPRDRGFGNQWERIGDHHYHAHRHRAALDAYTQALTGDWLRDDVSDRQRDIRVRIATSQLALGRLDEAALSLEALQRAVSLEPHAAPPRRNAAILGLEAKLGAARERAARPPQGASSQ